MKSVRHCAMGAVLITCVLSVQTVKAQELYGDRDNDKNIASGDLNDEDYWWAKFDAMMLDLNIKQDLGSSIRRLDDLARKYPTHREIAKWRARAMQADAKIGPSAIRGASFLPECPWDEATFAQLWVNLHWAKFAYDSKDYNTAYSNLQNVMQTYRIMLAPDRVKNYPGDMCSYVVDSKLDADNLYKSVKEKLHR